VKKIVFDIEATGLSPAQICQLSYLVIEDEKITAKNYFFSVDDMNPDAQAVHGFSMDDLDKLSGGERFEDRAEELFAEFSSAQLYIGHNIAADVRYIRQEFEKLGMKLPKINTFCTQNYFTSQVNLKMKVNIGRPKPPKLIELCEFFELSEEFISERAGEWFGDGAAAHDARFDTTATYLCMEAGTRRGMLRGVL